MDPYYFTMETLLKAKLFIQVIDTSFNGSAVLALGCVCLGECFELMLPGIGLKTEQIPVVYLWFLLLCLTHGNSLYA